MIRGVYSLASAMDTAAINHEIVANNLAHVNTPAAFPARRETFVAPVPPEPASLTSSPCVARTIKYPNGIDPSR